MIERRPITENRPLRLLIVDPVTHSRQSLTSYLQLQDWLEVVAESALAAEAIALIRQYRPDVVIMDANPLGMTGLAATRQLLSLDAHPAVILMAIHHSESDRQQAQLIGAAAYVTRSAGIDEILGVLQRLSGSNCQIVDPPIERRLK